jgi:hypothetical protein
MKERRAEPRLTVNAKVVITPLAAVTKRLHGIVVNASGKGLEVHLENGLTEAPRLGEVFRVQTGDDLMLCEVRHSTPNGAGLKLGLQIVHWAKIGQLKQLLKQYEDGQRPV